MGRLRLRRRNRHRCELSSSGRACRGRQAAAEPSATECGWAGFRFAWMMAILLCPVLMV